MKRCLLFLLCLGCILPVYGQVGIGTTTPNAKSILDLSSTSKGFLFPRMTYTERTAISTPPAGLLVYQTNSSPIGQSGIYIYDGSLWKRIARADEITGGSNNSWTTSGDNQYSNLAGNVGIGTDAPTTKFHLIGNMLQENGTLTLNNPTGIIQFQNAGVSKTFLQLSGNNLRLGTNASNTGGSVILRLGGTDRMVIDSVGSLGLGTNTPNPTAKLDIVSTSKGVLFPRMTTSQRFGISNPANGLIVYDTDKNEYFHYGGSEWKNILNSDYWVRPITNRSRITNVTDSIGIGTFGPQAKLHIIGGTFANFTTHNGYIMLGSSSSDNLVLGNYEILGRYNGGPTALYLQKSGGAVRIGNTGLTPTDTRFQISDGFNANLNENGYLLLGLTSGENIVMDENNIQARSNGAGTYLKLQDYSSKGVRIGFYNAPEPDTRLYIPYGDDASYSQDGYVHLGRKNDQNLIIDNNEILSRNNGGPATLTMQNNGGDLRIGSDNKMYVGTNGFVGLGTSSPLARLDVRGVIRSQANGGNIGLDGNTPTIDFWFSSIFHSWIGQYPSQFRIASNDPIRIETTGSVNLIGTRVAIGQMSSNADEYKLSVDGKVICEELKVETYENWPDYVFAPQYPLLSIHELKTFVDTHQHLPEIPEASEVAQTGIELGDMNKRLLQKVEELTLYVIQLQEQIDELKQKQ